MEEVIGNYKIYKTIGQGSFGKVKLAWHRLVGIRVAIKIIDRIYSPAVDRETAAWREMNHPNIARLYEILRDHQNIYLVCELCHGDVFNYILDHGRFSHDDAASIFRQLADAVAYCHENGFVHRDLKLENILIDEKHPVSSQNLHVKLIDFGFTKQFDKESLMKTFCGIILEFTILGSVAYASPEVIKGNHYDGPKSDVWSLGVIFFTLICGFLPFDNETQTEKEIQEKILAGKYDIPSYLHKVLESIFVIDPAKRIDLSALVNLPFFANTTPPVRSTLGFSLEDQQILTSLSDIGLDSQEIERSVKEKACNPASALFHLISAKKKSAGVGNVFEKVGLSESPVIAKRREILVKSVKKPGRRPSSSLAESLAAGNITEEGEEFFD